MPDTVAGDLLRQLAPQVLGAVVRRYGHFDIAEDATQEALVAAAMQWPAQGVPDNPRGWLITVASRRLTDLLRSEQARQRREDTVTSWVLPGQWLAPAADQPPSDSDDTLILLFMCCHPALSPASQIALTLRAVGGLATAEIARAFLVPEATMTRRISRAKQRIKDSGIPFGMPAGAERADRLAVVLHVLYLIFNEGYASTSGPSLQRDELAAEAIRLARLVRRLLPDDGEVTGLLALMLLTDARRLARNGPGGELIPMAEQDRSRWNAAQITEGVALITGALPRGPVGPYQLQAAIAAIHDEAATAEATDWPQIVALYGLLMQTADNPVVALNHAVAVAMAQGPREGLGLLVRLQEDERLAGDHRLHAVRAHLLEMSGDLVAARDSYLAAAEQAGNLSQQRYLYARAARLASDEIGGNLPAEGATRCPVTRLRRWNWTFGGVPMKRPAVFTIILLAMTTVGLLSGCGSGRGGAGAGTPVLAADQSAASRSAVVVNCLDKQQTRPSSFILTCADAGDVWTGVHWVNWESEAFGTGTEMIKTCKPNCAEGGFASYPVLITLWRPEPLPGHSGVLYFTRATRIYTANRPPLYSCHGSQTCYPLTSTFDLWSTQAAS